MKYRAKKRKEPESRSNPPWVVWGTALFLFLLPFVFSIDGFEKFRRPKDILALGVPPVLLLIWIMQGRPFRRYSLRSWEGALLIGVAYTGLHVFWSTRPDVSWWAFYHLGAFILFFFLLRELAEREWHETFWWALASASGINALFTVFQYLGKFPILELPGGEALQGRITPAGLIGDVNTGAFLFGLSCIILLHGVVNRRGKGRMAALLFLFLNLLGLAFTRTLTAFFSLSLVFLCWIAFHHWWLLRRQPVRARKQLGLLWLALLLGLSGSVAVFLASGVGSRVARTWEEIRRGELTTATAGRYPVFLITWEMIQERPWLGRGLGTFGQDFFYYRVGTPFGRRQELINQPGSFRETHNEYLQTWEELGVVGVLFLLLLLVWPLLRGAVDLRRIREPERAYWLGILLLGGLFVLLSCLSFFPLHLSLTAISVLLLLASLRQEQEGGAGGKQRPKGLAQTLFWVVLLILALSQGYRQIRRWQANEEMQRGVFLVQRAMSEQFDARQKQVLAMEALRRLQRALELDPFAHEAYNFQGSALMLLGRPEEAVQSYARAAFYLPSPEVVTNLAVAHMEAGQLWQARVLLDNAVLYNRDYGPGVRAREFLNKSRSP